MVLLLKFHQFGKLYFCHSCLPSIKNPGNSFAMFGWSWTDVSFLGSQVFGQASMETCEPRIGLYEIREGLGLGMSMDFYEK